LIITEIVLAQLPGCEKYLNNTSLEKIHKSIEDLESKPSSEENEFLLTTKYRSLANIHYCLTSPNATIEMYLNKSLALDQVTFCGPIISWIKDSTVLKTFNKEAYFIFDAQKYLKYDFINHCKRQLLDKDKNAIELIRDTILLQVYENDQSLRKKTFNKPKLESELANELRQIDSTNGIIINSYLKLKDSMVLQLNNKEREVISLVLLHQPPSYTQKYSSDINRWIKLSALPLYQFIVDRFFCKKYGSSPTGIYCEKNNADHLEEEKTSLFPAFND